MNWRIILILLLPYLGFSQWKDDFTDLNFTNDPIWVGDTGEFEVDSLARLHLKANPSLGLARLHTHSKIQNRAEWTFHVRMEFNPSSSNYVEIDLLRSSLLPESRRLFARVGGSSQDQISLIYFNGNSKSILIESAIDYLDTNLIDLNIKITHHAGKWNLYSQFGLDSSWTTHGFSLWNDPIPSEYFGFNAHFTSSRADLFYFDDISVIGQVHEVESSNTLMDWELFKSDSLYLYFAEDIGPETTTQLKINGIETDGMTYGIPNKLHLELKDIEYGDTLHLEWSLVDEWDNQTWGIEKIRVDSLIYRDLLFSEILYDPFPVVEKLDQEFVEIYNRSYSSVQLNNWQLCINGNCKMLPLYRLEPNQFLLFADDSLNTRTTTEVLNYISLDLPSLPNSGGTLELKNQYGHLIDRIIYDPSFHDNPSKSEGGWSIEKEYESCLCQNAESWRSSLGIEGASPGWNEDGICDSKSNPNWGFQLVYGDGFAISANKEIFLSPRGEDQKLNEIYFESGQSSIHIPTNADSVLVHFDGVFMDCTGKEFPELNRMVRHPEGDEFNGVVVNEIMFDPEFDEVEFIEILNDSGKDIDIWNLGVAKYDSIFNLIETPHFFTEEHLILPTSEMTILTEDENGFKKSYQSCDSMMIVECNLPTLTNDGQSMVLINRKQEIIEVFTYKPEWHHYLIGEGKGFSLERISSNLPPTRKEAWHSAASHSKSSPNCTNTQFQSDVKSMTMVSLDYDEFSPNNDGYRDQLPIRIEGLDLGTKVELSIYNFDGNPIRHLHLYDLGGSSNLFHWDGMGENNQVMPYGAYIVITVLTGPYGEREIQRLPCVLRD